MADEAQKSTSFIVLVVGHCREYSALRQDLLDMLSAGLSSAVAAVPPPAGVSAPAPLPAAAAAASSQAPLAGLVVPEVVEVPKKDAAGTVTMQHFHRGVLLGKGGFAKCYLFEHQERNRIVAGKCISKASLQRSKARNKVSARPRFHVLLYLFPPAVIRVDWWVVAPQMRVCVLDSNFCRPCLIHSLHPSQYRPPHTFYH